MQPPNAKRVGLYINVSPHSQKGRFSILDVTPMHTSTCKLEFKYFTDLLTQNTGQKFLMTYIHAI